MIRTKKVLILEDNFQVLSRLLHALHTLEGESEYDFELMILTSSQQVSEYLDNGKGHNFDIVLIDRDCKIHQSFHILDIETIGTSRVIGISSISSYNDDLKKRGVTRIVEKDLSDIDGFVERVIEQIKEMLVPEHLMRFMRD